MSYKIRSVTANVYGNAIVCIVDAEYRIEKQKVL